MQIFLQIFKVILIVSINRYALLGASGCGKTSVLSCIVGMLKFDSGSINVLGRRVDENFVARFGHKIGFMPQDTSLIPELTVKETIYFFGHLCQMSKDKLRKRYSMLSELLELPPDERRVEECSGGQQRRVSFCVSVIHEPELLILDEPTVGLDPVLREKIWDFMLRETRNSQLSIIITTHYIEEARLADRCGLMRNGILLAEDTPNKIMEKHQCETLEKAFLKLCTKQDKNPNKNDGFALKQSTSNDVNKIIDLDSYQRNTQKEPAHQQREKFKRQTFRALITKNFTQIKRQPA